MAVHALYERLRAELAAIQASGALSAALAGELLMDLSHRVRPARLGEAGPAADALVRLSYLMCQRAPSLDGRDVALSPVNRAFYQAGMRTLPEVVDELMKLEEASGGPAAALDALLTTHGEALVGLVVTGGDRVGERIEAETTAHATRQAGAADAGRWDEVQIEGPDAAIIRDLLRALPADTARAVHAAWGRATAAVEDERLPDARAALDEAIGLAPELFETWVRRARVRFAAEDRPGAGADVERAIHLHAGATAPRALRAELRTIFRDVKGALEDWDAAVAGAPGHVPYLLGRGYTRLAANRADDAFSDFSEAVRAAPRDKTPLFARAELRVRGRDLNGAAEDYGRVLAIDPDDLQALLNRGTVRLMARRSEEALADLTVVTEKRPADPTAWGRRAAALVQLGQPWPAWVDALTALALAPDDWAQSDQVEQILQAAYQQLAGSSPVPEELVARADLVQRKAGGREVVRMADRLGRWLPAEAVVWHRIRGDLYLAYGKWSEAAGAFKDALAVDPNDAGALLGAGRAALGSGKAEAALEALDRARASAHALDDAGTFELHLARGRALGTVGQLAAAIAAFDEALALRPDRGDVWFYKGVHASLAGDGAGAEAAYTVSLERSAGFAPAWFNRACERARLGQLDGALDDLERAVGLDKQWAKEAAVDSFLVPLRGHARFEALVAGA